MAREGAADRPSPGRAPGQSPSGRIHPSASAGRPPAQEAPAAGRLSAPLPLRPRGGFGTYLHELRRERGLTVRQLAAAAGVHHTYVSKLERGDRQAPETAVVEALAAALEATPAQVDQLRWRAGLSPQSGGAAGQDDPTLTLVAEALGDPALPLAGRDRLRQAIATMVRAQVSGHTTSSAASEVVAEPRWPQARGTVDRRAGGWSLEATTPSPAEAVPDGRATLLAGLLGGWQTLEEAAAELRVPASYLWELIQAGQLRAWSLPSAAPDSVAGVRLRREDVLGLLQPMVPLGSPAARR